jgi:hypothetical protein
METRTADVATTPQSIAHLDRLGDEIAELAAHLDAATARLLDLIREFDAREGWNTGFRSCAAWLTWRIGLSPGAAREHVRVARALGTLPQLRQALARGEVSYSKVRERAGTAEHVERIVRGWRRVDRHAEAREAARQHTSRALHVYQDDDGMVVLRGRLAPEVGAVLVQALAAARDALYQRARATDVSAETSEGVSAETLTLPQQQADALALLAEAALHHGLDPGAPGERYHVVVHVNAAVLADADQPGQSVLEGGARVPAGTSQRLACDASRVVMRHAPDGRVVEVGARTRTIPRRFGARSTIETAPVASRAVGCRSVRDITCVTGRREAPPRSPTWPCSVAATTTPSTRAATSSIESPTAPFGSAGRTAGFCPTSRLHATFPRMSWRSCEPGTTPRGCAYTRGRPRAVGSGSRWTWAGRSTSCIRSPGRLDRPVTAGGRGRGSS